MPQRSQSQQSREVLLEERALKILERLLSSKGKVDPEKEAQIILRLPAKKRILAHIIRHLKDFDSLQEYLVDLLDRDIEDSLPYEVRLEIEKKSALL